MKPKLNNVSVCIIDCVNYGEAISALRKSMYQVDFAKAIFLTDIQAYNPNFPFEIVKIDKIASKEAYSEFVIKELYKYFDTEFVLLIQHDGYVIDGNAWDDEFLKYDYIGAPWLYTDGKNVGNGGCSIRSYILQLALGTDDFIEASDPEDQAIGRLYRDYLIKKHDITFAPEEVADRFSYELREPICSTFAFHGKFHPHYKETVVIRRQGALGDIVALEPVLEYYHNKGCNVVVDIPIHLALVYAKHYFDVKHISQITDGRVPLTRIDLDGSYEANPKQLHLKSYYETAGITDGKIKSPKLNFPIGEHNRLFKKYFVIHNDQRDQKYRNTYGVNWDHVATILNEKGYTVIQVGLSLNEEIKGAIWMNTPTTNMLLYVIAGASGFVGIDSGPAAIAVACNIPSAIFFGSVDPKVIHPDLSNVQVIELEKVCDTPKCWGDVVGGFTGKECAVDAEAPPCTQYTTQMAIDALNKML